MREEGNLDGTLETPRGKHRRSEDIPDLPAMDVEGVPRSARHAAEAGSVEFDGGSIATESPCLGETSRGDSAEDGAYVPAIVGLPVNNDSGGLEASAPAAQSAAAHVALRKSKVPRGIRYALAVVFGSLSAIFLFGCLASVGAAIAGPSAEGLEGYDAIAYFFFMLINILILANCLFDELPGAARRLLSRKVKGTQGKLSYRPIFNIVAFVILFTGATAFGVASQDKSFESYDWSLGAKDALSEGQVLSAEDFQVTAIRYSGERVALDPETDYALVDENQPIVIGENAYQVKILDKTFSFEFTFKGSLKSLSATYSGSTEAGHTPSLSEFVVTGTYEDGSTEAIADAQLANASALVPEETTRYTLTCDDLSCNVDVTCTTTVAEQQQKEEEAERQRQAEAEAAAEAEAEKQRLQEVANATTEEKNALKKAQQYSSKMYMSKARLYEQLTSEYGEGFTAEAAQFAIDHVDADWYANALETAKNYQENMSMSKSRIYEQLVSEYGEGFTAEEAQYAVDNLPD